MADIALEEIPSLEEIQTMKVTELKKKLKLFGLPLNGNKTELAERLQEACLTYKADSYDNSQLSFDDSQIELESAEENAAIEDDNEALLEQEHFSSYISSPSMDENKALDAIEKSSAVSNPHTMPLKKRTFTSPVTGSTGEKKITIKRTNIADIEFDIKQNEAEAKPISASLNNKSNSEEKVVLSVKNMSAAERLALRAKRFNTGSTGGKTAITSVKSVNNKNSKQSIISSATTPELDKLKKRAERFGQSVSTVLKQLEQKERLLKRKCKFGANLSVAAVSTLDEQERKKKRAERFGIS